MTDVIPVVGFYVAFVVVASIYGSPAAGLGCLVVHFLCLRVRSQVVHVAAAALVGVAAGWAYGTVLFDGYWEQLWWQLGIATAIGRAVVIPLARRRRRETRACGGCAVVVAGMLLGSGLLGARSVASCGCCVSSAVDGRTLPDGVVRRARDRGPGRRLVGLLCSRPRRVSALVVRRWSASPDRRTPVDDDFAGSPPGW